MGGRVRGNKEKFMSIALVLFIIAAVVAGVEAFNTRSLLAVSLLFIAAGLAVGHVGV